MTVRWILAAAGAAALAGCASAGDLALKTLKNTGAELAEAQSCRHPGPHDAATRGQVICRGADGVEQARGDDLAL